MALLYIDTSLQFQCGCMLRFMMQHMGDLLQCLSIRFFFGIGKGQVVMDPRFRFRAYLNSLAEKVNRLTILLEAQI